MSPFGAISMSDINEEEDILVEPTEELKSYDEAYNFEMSDAVNFIGLEAFFPK